MLRGIGLTWFVDYCDICNYCLDCFRNSVGAAILESELSRDECSVSVPRDFTVSQFGAVRTTVGCDSSTGSSKASERNVCEFSSLKNEPKPDLAEERYGMNSRAFERPFGIEWISSRTTVEM